MDRGVLGRSGRAPAGRLSDGPPGFSATEVEGQAWFVFAAEDPARGPRGEHRRRPRAAGGARPALLALIWLSLGRGPAPLGRFARARGEARL